MTLPIETPGQVAQQALGGVGVIEFPALAQPPTERRPERLGQAIRDVARLMDLAAWGRRMLAEGVADARVSALAPSTMNRRQIVGPRPRSIEMSSRAWIVTAFSVAPSSSASGCLSPPPSLPSAATIT